jgi:hypothetical protein
MASPLMAQTCPSPAGWANPVHHLAAHTAELKFSLATGTSTEIGLLRANAVRLVVKGERPPKADSSAGLAALMTSRVSSQMPTVPDSAQHTGSPHGPDVIAQLPDSLRESFSVAMSQSRSAR